MLSPIAVAAVAVGTAGAQPDPSVMSFTLPDRIAWTGDPAKSGPYAVLVKWPPHRMSRPRTHPHDRHITVISGGQPHSDGAKDEPAVLEIVGEGPAKTTPAT